MAGALLSELKQRGLQDVLICCVDGLKGFPEGDRGQRGSRSRV